MLDGQVLVDAHVHVPVLPSVAPAWVEWARQFGRTGVLEEIWRGDGTPDPAALDRLFAEEGVDVALLFCEYSPKVTGYQLFDDLLPLVEQNPRRFRPVANVNPHLHFPIVRELTRQLDQGAAALKVHPVHGGFHLDAVLRDFPDLQVVLAHGGRGWWYDAAAFLAVSRPNVWIELSGLPPQRLPEYYARFDLPRLARKFIYGTDWPGVPGTAANARAVAGLGIPDDVVPLVLGQNAMQVYAGLDPVR